MRNLGCVDIQRFCVTGSSDSWLESAGNSAAMVELRDFRNRTWFARQATQAGEGGNPAPRHREDIQMSLEIQRRIIDAN